MNLLLCYDGSPDAKAAVARAAGLFGDATAVVLTVSDTFSEVVAASSLGMPGAALDFEAINTACEQAARELAEGGTSHARAAGLAASSRVAERKSTVWETILDQADQVNADMIVVGTRGLTGVRSVVMGSVSRALLQHSTRPVLVVPAVSQAVEQSGRARRQQARRDPILSRAGF
jgi:nucleotide-binding universal stress UspA family protein